MTTHRFRARPWFAFLMAVALVSCDSSSTEPSPADNEPPQAEDPDPPAPPSITTASLPSGEVGEPYAVTLEAVDGDGTFAWAVAAGALPDGLSPAGASGTISGTPTTDGSFDFTAQVTSGGQSDTKDLSVEIVAVGGGVFSTVVNVDWDADATAVYVGDDAVYSTGGGTYWNPWSSSSLGSPVTNLADEFGAPTAVDVFTDISGLSFIGAATNEMQNEGIWDSGAVEDARIEWRGLESDGVYDLAGRRRS